MRTEKQIEIYFFKKAPEGKILFLLAKRTPKRGGFWQPLTGGVEQGETLEQTITRESEEEFGITKINKVINTGYSFEFDYEGHHSEDVFGAEVEFGIEIILSDEHSEFKWLEKDEVFKLLIWPGNIEGFKKLCKILKIGQ
ncbi:NUDIX domain-containing protein [Patescibacteria group bacterium]|nr:NUDIX domain-containing protein [Patescibacteria group bacterium]MBU4511828.1 NUDIX domain-containing protein [Patescibacteria group bacterium]MCG2692736.1 NUDIX domain-containing protein [Candidatus Parcubacteria bacterium]